MTRIAATIVTAEKGMLDDGMLDAVARALKALGVERLEIAPLAPGRAADIRFDGGEALLDAAREKLAHLSRADVFVQPDDAFRRKRLLVSDMDATVVIGETLDEVARLFGLEDKIVPITERAMRGELDFAQALKERVGLLRGKPAADLEKVGASLRLSKGGDTLVKTMRRHGARCILVSGGFDVFTARVAGMVGFDAHFGNRLGVENGLLTGGVEEPVVCKDFKKRKLLSEAAALGIDPRQTMAVGDGANDIPMLAAAGAGVGYFAKPVVEAATPHNIRHSDLTALLYMQGYAEGEIAR